MVCEFCREPLNDGATVCKHCARRQPLTDRERFIRFGKWAGAVLAVIFLGWTGSEIYRDKASIDRCASSPSTIGFVGIQKARDYCLDLKRSLDREGRSELFDY